MHLEKLLPGSLLVSLFCFASTGKADRGEGFLSIRGFGNLSRLRHPDLTYSYNSKPINTITTAIEIRTGIGVTDWIDLAIGGRLGLPIKIVDQNTSTQGFPYGDATYQAMNIQIPLSATARYYRGSSISMSLTAEAGIQWSRWQLISLIDYKETGKAYNISPKEQWSTTFFGSISPMMEWRIFDYFALYLGPRLTMGTDQSIYLGLGAGGSVIFGAGIF